MASSDTAAVDLLPDLLIPMRDGVRLAANLYRPAGGGRRPCLVNYLPYHKDGRGGLAYDPIHRFFARRGYASLVIDFRGLGCSEGLNNTPFDAQEGHDGHDAVEWAAAQEWCDGRVGMWGTSYGGITALKAAAERPPHLRAIVPIHATADNFLDFLLLGGCRNGFWASGDWGPRMIGYNLTPPLGPDPDGRLARLWAERLERSRPWCLDWYDPVDETARWARRAIPVERITAATFAVGGWQDFYAQGLLDYFQRLTAPKKLLMGPWKHAFPNLSAVEPLNLVEMMVDWWDRWLRGEANGAEASLPITLFVQGRGVWRYEADWPPRRNEPRTFYLLPGQLLGEQPSREPARRTGYRHDPTAGLDSIGADPWTVAVVDPGTHNGDDARSLCFTTEPLAEDWELTGQAHVVLAVRPSVPGLNYAAKLCDVEPGGGSRLVTLGWRPDPGVEANALREVDIPLRATSHLFAQGHRLRLAIALADFPRLWPTPEPGEIQLEFSASPPPRLLLPRTPPQQSAPSAPEFPAPGPDLHSPFELEAAQTWRVGHELVRQAAELESRGASSYQLRDGGTVTYRHEYTAAVAAAEPAGAAIRVRSAIEVRRPAGTTLVKTAGVFTPRAVSIEVEIEQGGVPIHRRQWKQERDPMVTG
jgi:predicted acyl esterase